MAVLGDSYRIRVSVEKEKKEMFVIFGGERQRRMRVIFRFVRLLSAGDILKLIPSHLIEMRTDSSQ